MTYIIDTHIFLWLLYSPEKLPDNAIKVIKTHENQIYVSDITFWEISLKFSLGKLDLKGIMPDELPHYCNEAGLQILPLDSELLSSFYKLPRLTHKDPFDRMIIWQAISKKMTLISVDGSFGEYEMSGLKLL